MTFSESAAITTSLLFLSLISLAVHVELSGSEYHHFYAIFFCLLASMVGITACQFFIYPSNIEYNPNEFSEIDVGEDKSESDSELNESQEDSEFETVESAETSCDEDDENVIVQLDQEEIDPNELYILDQLQGLAVDERKKTILKAYRLLQNELKQIQPPVPNRILIKKLVTFFYGYQVAEEVALQMKWLRNSPFSIAAEQQLGNLVEQYREELLRLADEFDD